MENMNLFDCYRCGHVWLSEKESGDYAECPSCHLARLGKRAIVALPPETVVIFMDHGLISEIVSTRPVLVTIIDSDIDGIDESDLSYIPQTNGSSEPRYVTSVDSTVSKERVVEMTEILEEISREDS